MCSVTAPCCAEGELQTAVDRLVEAVADLVRMYCVAHRTKFFLSSSLDMPCGEVEDSFFLSVIARACRFLLEGLLRESMLLMAIVTEGYWP